MAVGIVDSLHIRARVGLVDLRSATTMRRSIGIRDIGIAKPLLPRCTEASSGKAQERQSGILEMLAVFTVDLPIESTREHLCALVVGIDRMKALRTAKLVDNVAVIFIACRRIPSDTVGATYLVDQGYGQSDFDIVIGDIVPRKLIAFSV